jgi:hypothetical protein
MLSIAKGKIIMPILFLKNKPTGSLDNVMLPSDVIKLSKE